MTTEFKRYTESCGEGGGVVEHPNGELVSIKDFDRVTDERDAALVEVERLKNMNHRQILAESAAKYLLDSGAENFVGDVFTIEADDGQTKFEVIVTTQKVGAKSPGELCNELQQRLTAADERVDVLENALRRIARPHDCGCLPCNGDCTSKMALEITVEEMRETARAALKPAEGGGDESKPANPRRILSDPHCSECGHPDCNGQCFGDDMMGD